MIEYRFRVPSVAVFTLYSYYKALEYRFRVPTMAGLRVSTHCSWLLPCLHHYRQSQGRLQPAGHAEKPRTKARQPRSFSQERSHVAAAHLASHQSPRSHASCSLATCTQEPRQVYFIMYVFRCIDEYLYYNV
jgi:hypothetical protein